MPINNITQTISKLPAAGKRGADVQTVFVTKQEDFQDHLQGITVTELNTLKDQLNTRIGEINSTATTMNGYASTASAGASTATTKASEASTSASGALTSKNQASTFATNSSNSATKASQWADNNYNVEVETGKYSAKHWSTVAQNVVGDTVKLTGNQTVSDVKTFSSIIVGSITGNATTATKLATARTINGVSFDGSANIIVSDSTAVKLTGNQTIAGVKTFSLSPIVPVPTTDFQSVPLKSTDITVNVGAGQTYTTINQALEYLSGFYPMYKKSLVTATINLKAGFVMAEQVLVSGIDLGWITIVGEDVETIITHTSLSISFNGTNYPAFGVGKGGTSPIIGQLFRFNVEKVDEIKHGLMTYGTGSSATVLFDKGFIGAGTYGIYATRGSIVNAEGANCSNAGTTGIHATRGSLINAKDVNCSNAGTNGIYVTHASIVNAEGANCSNAGTTGIHVNQSSIVNAYSANCSNAGTNGIYANKGSTINAEGANCSNAGTTGIYASYASTINANVAIIQNQTTGTARISVTDGSTIEASGIDTTGGTVPVFNQAVNTLTSNGVIYN